MLSLNDHNDIDAISGTQGGTWEEANSQLAHGIERWPVVQEVEGSSPGQTNTQGLKTSEKNMPPSYIKKWLHTLVFSDRYE